MKIGTIMTVAGAGLMALAAEAQTIRHGPPIRFSAPKSDTVGTNLNQFTDKARNNLRRLEEELSQPLDVFRQQDSARPMAAPLPRPPAGPVIQNKRIRELLDKKNNWVFMSPEDQVTGLTAEEIFGLTELDETGGPKARATSLERYNERLDRERIGSTNGVTSDGIGRWASEAPWRMQADEENQPRNPVQARLMDSERALQDLLKTPPNLSFLPEIRPRSSYADPLAPNPVKTTEKSWEQKAQEARLEQFRQMIQPETPKPASLPGLASGGSAGSSFTPLPSSSPAGATTVTPHWAEPKPATPSASSAGQKPFATGLKEMPRRKF